MINRVTGFFDTLNRMSNYGPAEARALANQVREYGFMERFPEVYYCLRDCARADDSDGFQGVVEAVLSYSVEKNLKRDPKQVRLVSLRSLLEVCIQADQGVFVAGFKATPPKKAGRTQAQFLDLYQLEMVEAMAEVTEPVLTASRLKFD